jgi:hypothetical protein
MFPRRVISPIRFTRARLTLTVLGSLCLLHFSCLYKLVAALFICLKLVIVFDMPSVVSYKFAQTDLGWYLVASATSLLILQIILKSIQYTLQTIALFLNRLECAAKIHLYQILFIELIGVVLMFHEKLHVEAVTPLSPSL